VPSLSRRSTRRWTVAALAVALVWMPSGPAAHASSPGGPGGLGGARAGTRAAPRLVPPGTTVSVVLGATNTDNGLAQVDGPDGRTAPVTAGGLSGRSNAQEDQPTYPHNIYFQVADNVAYAGSYVAQVSVQYYDQGSNTFALQYDSTDCSAPVSGAYKQAGTVTETSTGTWKTATLILPDAYFGNRENNSADFRLAMGSAATDQLTVHQVTVTFQQDNTPVPPTPAAGTPNPSTTVTLQRTADRVTLDNGYVRVGFDLAHPQIDLIQADFDGRSRYAANLAAAGIGDPLHRSGIVLERDDPDGAAHASSAGPGPNLAVHVISDSTRLVIVRIDGIVDDPASPAVTSSWTISLAANERAFRLGTQTRALRAAQVADVHLAAYWSAPDLNAWFDRGVVQMLNNPAGYFASTATLQRFYAVGSLGGGTVDVTATGGHQTLLRSTCNIASAAFASGLGQELAGSYPVADQWSSAGWSAATPVTLAPGQGWATTATVAANSMNFPDGGPLITPKPNLPEASLQAFETSVYATAAGMLDTYALLGEAAPNLATPARQYGDGRNFYDPDTWMIASTLLYSGDPYLQQQARTLIEKSGSAILPSGQIPHHFNGATPTYVAISGATQTGPNIFWIEAALQYAKATGDTGWLRTEMPTIEHALSFLTSRYDPRLQLVNAPGPLWIDVFIRDNYTSDTNAFMVQLLRDVAGAERFLGDAGNATVHEAMASDIVTGMNTHLWAGDHYITQLNPDGTTRDFVDYDANLLAVAFGIAPPGRAKLVLARIDSGSCTHAGVSAGQPRPTWVSEKYYGPTDTYGGNTGDSAVTMGRIGWADGHARRAAGDLATFDNLILNPIQQQVDTATWLPERYDCSGDPAHSPYYHEYPEMTVMLMREVRYGINLGLGTVTIDPFGPSSFSYHLGDVNVDYSQRYLTLNLPGSGARAYTITGLARNASYLVLATGRGAAQRQSAHTDSQGTLTFTGPTGPQWTLRVQLTA
jgi:hypothetical protein